MIIYGKTYILKREFDKFGKMDSRHYKLKLISGNWPDYDELLEKCSNGEPNGGGVFNIKERTGRLTIYNG